MRKLCVLIMIMMMPCASMAAKQPRALTCKTSDNVSVYIDIDAFTLTAINHTEKFDIDSGSQFSFSNKEYVSLVTDPYVGTDGVQKVIATMRDHKTGKRYLAIVNAITDEMISTRPMTCKEDK